MNAIPIPHAAGAVARPSIPWQCYVMVAAATCIWIGITWDISWHQTIGRDTFWTPAHLVIYVGGTVSGLCGGWLIVRATLTGTEAERAASVRVWGLRGPLGAWVAVWAALAMVVSAPFDDWWHNAYGLDVQILSPPHAVLAAGMHHVEVGAMLLVAGVQNRSRGLGRPVGAGLFIYTGGVMLALASLIIYELSLPNQQHGAAFYFVSAVLFPGLLVTVARASRLRWAATLTALVYMGLRMAIGWILPLFEGRPMLAPIYTPLDHMVPPAFPLLLVAPALVIDLCFLLLGKGKSWWRAPILILLISAGFLALFFVTQWNFSKFLLSPAADNWFFAGNRYWSFNTGQGDFRTRFWLDPGDAVTVASMAWAWWAAVISTAVGLVWGWVLDHVRR